MDFQWIYTPCKDMGEAQKIGSALVEEKLVACANIFPGMISIYAWQGEVEQAQEVVLVMKSTGALFSQIEQRIQALHSYEIPCIIALPIQQGNDAYLSWIKNAVKI